MPYGQGGKPETPAQSYHESCHRLNRSSDLSKSNSENDGDGHHADNSRANTVFSTGLSLVVEHDRKTGEAHPYVFGGWLKLCQDLPDTFIDNESMSWVHRQAFAEQQNWLPKKSRGYQMPRYKSVSVDWPEDLELLTYYYQKIIQRILQVYKVPLIL